MTKRKKNNAITVNPLWIGVKRRQIGSDSQSAVISKTDLAIFLEDQRERDDGGLIFIMQL